MALTKKTKEDHEIDRDRKTDLVNGEDPPTILREEYSDRKTDSAELLLQDLVSSLNQCSLRDKQQSKNLSSEQNESIVEPPSQLLSQIIQKETLRVDQQLCDQLRSRSDIAGTTSLMAALLPQSNVLLVANVGDSRAVLCDNRGNAIPLSHDHKPNYVSHSIDFNVISFFQNSHFIVIKCSRKNMIELRRPVVLSNFTEFGVWPAFWPLHAQWVIFR